MKTTKKVLALIVVMMMVLGMTSAFAATITVTGAYENETYDAYKILEYTSSGDAYSYYLETSNENYAALKALLEGCTPAFAFTVSADGTQAFVNNSDALKDKGAEIAAYLYENLDTLKTIALAKSEGNKGTADKTVVMEDLPQGYWFVTSSLGSLCTLQSYSAEELVVEKNEVITPPEKEASDTEYQVGDTISYTITYKDVKGTNNDLTIVDTMTAGLTYKADTLKVTINGTETPATSTTGEGAEAVTTTNYTVTPTADTAGATLTIVFPAAVVDALQEGETIVITYDALVNNNASLDGTEMNTVVGRTSNQETTPVNVPVTSSDLTVNKTDGTDALKGAKFELYRTTDQDGNATHEIVKLRQLSEDEIKEALGKDEQGNQIEAAADTVYYVVDTSSTNTTIDMAQKNDAGEYLYSSARIFGIDKDSTYGLLEIKAPEGYNQLAEEKPVSAGLNTIDVVNQKGSVLPSTGGVGTTMIYVIGSLLVLVAGVVLISKRRVGSR